MSLRDIREIGVWALATALLAAGTLAPRPVDSAGSAPAAARPTATIDGCTVSATAAASALPYRMDVTLQAENPSPDARDCRVALTLVRQEFNGSPFSRVVRPTDYQRTIERTVEVDMGPVGSSPVEKSITLAIDARPTPAGTGSSFVVNAAPASPAPIAAVTANAASATVVRGILANAGGDWVMDGLGMVGRAESAAAAPVVTQRAVWQPMSIAQAAVQRPAQAPAAARIALASMPRSAPVYLLEVTPSGAKAPVVLASLAASEAWPKP